MFFIEFAKEAMACQALEHGEVLSIRWAHDDPNPVAKDSIQRADADAMVALLRAKGISLTPAGYDYPAEYQLPSGKRLKTEEGGAYIEANPEIAYPDTDAQYAAYYNYMNSINAAGSSSTTEVGTTENALPWAGYSSNNTVQQPTSDDKKSALARLGLMDSEEPKDSKGDESQGEEDEEEEGGWEKCTDDTTGAIYYFNTATGESSWTVPEGFQGK